MLQVNKRNLYINIYVKTPKKGIIKAKSKEDWVSRLAFQQLLGSDIKGDEYLPINPDFNLNFNETHIILTTAFTLGE